MAAGWTCTILSELGDLALEQVDDAGREWRAEGPGGDAVGGLRGVLAAAADHRVDRVWLDEVVGAIERELDSRHRRLRLLVRRVTGRWFHATFVENRESILRHGLDYRRMDGPGIAGSVRAEAAGVFLTCDLESARWFARMGRRGAVDIWAADLVDVWLVGDPGDNGGGDDGWMICPAAILPIQLTLIERDIEDSF